MKKQKQTPKPSPTRNEHFERIETTPEELARVFLQTPKKKDWEYMKKIKGSKPDNPS